MRRGPTWPPPGQAGAAQDASIPEPGIVEHEQAQRHPGISSAVMKLPAQARSTAMPRARNTPSAWRATIASSIGGVPPSPFTSSATRCRLRDHLSRAACPGSHRPPVRRFQLATPHALLAVDAEAEFHFVLAEREAGLARGRHGAGAERHAHGAERCRRGAASATTARVERPAAAAAPATLCTSTDRQCRASVRVFAPCRAARHRRRRRPPFVGHVLAGVASAAARPKLRRSPV